MTNEQIAELKRWAEGIDISNNEATLISNKFGMVSIDAARTIIAQHEEIERLRESVSALESKRPHWAQGYSSDSVAAQVSHDALTQLWQLLGADNQTEALAAVEKEWLDIEQFKPDNRKKCLVVVNGYGVHIDKYYEGKGFREYDGYITHWMPLQQPPKGESDEC